jgi:Ca-activated chloride channel family protein
MSVLFNLVVMFLCGVANLGYASHPGIDAYNQQAFDQAKTAFEAALVKHPDSGKVNYNLGNTYFKLKDTQRAIQAYEEAIPLLNENDKTNAYYNLGTAHLNNNDFKQALSAYREVLTRDPSHLKAKQNLEWALRQQDMPPQASNGSQNQTDDTTDDTDAQSNDQPTTEDVANREEEEDKQSANNDEQMGGQEPESTTKEGDEAPKTPQTLSEEQIEYLVNNAEKEAREKRRQKQASLFEGDQW